MLLNLVQKLKCETN